MNELIEDKMKLELGKGMGRAFHRGREELDEVTPHESPQRDGIPQTDRGMGIYLSLYCSQ